MLLYYITDRRQFPGGEDARRQRLLENIAEAARCGVEYIQLREKDLSTRELEQLARQLRTESSQRKTAFLINSRTDVALAAGADGVHLRANDVVPEQVRQIWQLSRGGRPLIAVSCHTQAEVAAAASQRADFAVFAPVFEKKDSPATPPAGLEALRRACQYKIPVLALGGVTLENAHQCIEAGAAGIAGIRLFQQSRIEDVVRRLRG